VSRPIRAPRRVGALPLGVRRVLVLGGDHADAAALRERVVQAGGVAAVNVTLSVTDVVCLDGWETDRRIRRIERLGLPVQTVDDFLSHLDTLGALLPVSTGPIGSATLVDAVRQAGVDGEDEPLEAIERVLARGAVVDLPPRRSRQDWTVTATWDWYSPGEVDLVAFLLGGDERVESDEDMVFYNQPQSADGSVALQVDGPAEQAIALELNDVPPSVRRVVIAAALDGEGTFGDVGPVAIAAQGADGRVLLRATLDAATTERTLLLAEIYRRGDIWRFRAVGQGYNHGLAKLATSYGVIVDAG
jgi:DNA polymerase-3 subunit epsilon